MAASSGCGITVHTEQPAEETISVSEAALSTVDVHISQVVPTFNTTGDRFVWEAFVYGFDPDDCSYKWTIEGSGTTTILLKQTTWVGGHELSNPGEYNVHVHVTCSEAGGAQSTGSASLVVDVFGIGPTYPSYYSPPPSGSIIPVATGSYAPPTGPNVYCVYWEAYDYQKNKYYTYRSSYCPGGGGRRAFGMATWE